MLHVRHVGAIAVAAGVLVSIALPAGAVAQQSQGNPGAVAGGSTSPSQAEAAKARLEGLRRSVAHLGVLDAIIARYEQAMGELAGTDVAEETQQDLEMWQQRRDQGCKRLGKTWLRPDQIALVRERPGDLAQRAVALASAGRWDQALPLLDVVLQVDPKNPTAQYLTGLVAWRADRPTAASMCFQRVLEAQPDHGPSLNNLAVMQSLRWRGSLAAANFRLAMRAMPHDDIVCHNVAEFLMFLPGNMKGVTMRFSGRIVWIDRPLSPEEILPLRELLDRQDNRPGATKRKEGSGWVTERKLRVTKERYLVVQQRDDVYTGHYYLVFDADRAPVPGQSRAPATRPASAR